MGPVGSARRSNFDYYTRMKTTVCFILVFAAACNRADEQVSEEPQTFPVNEVMVDTTPKGPITFDADSVKPGDQLGAFKVKQVRRPPDDHAVSFDGEAELNGKYMVLDNDQQKVPCFFVDSTHYGRLPRATTDSRILWFCFENAAEAGRQLGSAQAHATIVIDNYRTSLAVSDVWNSARLMRVISRTPIQ